MEFHWAIKLKIPAMLTISQGWENILVEQFPPTSGWGKVITAMNTRFVCLLHPRPVHFLQIKEEEPLEGWPGRWPISITPTARVPFCSWDETTTCIFALPLVSSRALPKPLTWIPISWNYASISDSIPDWVDWNAASCWAKTRKFSGRLHWITGKCIGSAFALDSTLLPNLAFQFEGGLPERQLLQVLEYINEHLNQDIKLALLGVAEHEPISFQPSV